MPQPTHTQTPTIQFSVINESTVLADADVVPVVAALQKQVTNDFGPVWGTAAQSPSSPRAISHQSEAGGSCCSTTPTRPTLWAITISPPKGSPSARFSRP